MHNHSPIRPNKTLQFRHERPNRSGFGLGLSRSPSTINHQPSTTCKTGVSTGVFGVSMDNSGPALPTTLSPDNLYLTPNLTRNPNRCSPDLAPSRPQSFAVHASAPLPECGSPEPQQRSSQTRTNPLPTMPTPFVVHALACPRRRLTSDLRPDLCPRSPFPGPRLCEPQHRPTAPDVSSAPTTRHGSPSMLPRGTTSAAPKTVRFGTEWYGLVRNSEFPCGLLAVNCPPTPCSALPAPCSHPEPQALPLKRYEMVRFGTVWYGNPISLVVKPPSSSVGRQVHQQSTNP